MSHPIVLISRWRRHGLSQEPPANLSPDEQELWSDGYQTRRREGQPVMETALKALLLLCFVGGVAVGVKQGSSLGAWIRRKVSR